MAHTRHPRTTGRLTAALAAAAAITAMGGGAAVAHVEPQTAEITAGSPAEVALTVQHGCDGSPTVKLEIQVPESIDDLQPVDKEGWTGSVADGVATFTGGPLPDDVEDQFAVRFTAPDEPGTLRFKMIQTCETGTIDWIQEDEGADRPAPVVQVVAAPAGATTTTAPVEVTTTTAPVDPTTTTTSEAATTTTVSEPGEATPDEDEEDDGPGATPWIVGAVVVVAGAGGGAFLWSRRAGAA